MTILIMMDFQTVMTLSQKLSEELIAAEKTFRYLRTPEGRVALPVAVHGAPPKLAFVPDVTAIAQAASREALTGVLEKALGGKRAQQGDAEAEASVPEAPSAQQPPQPTTEELGRDLLRRGLGELLGGEDQ